MAINSAKQIIEKLITDTLVVDEKLKLTYDTRTGPGAVSVETPVTLLVTEGADALTLADGEDGQVKIVIMTTDGGDGTLTPDNFANGTNITFEHALDMWAGIFVLGNWYSIVTPTATVA